MIIEKTASYLFSSDPANGAQSLSKDGNAFVAVLSEPIAIPKTAVYCTTELTSAVVVNVFPNVSEEIGNNIFRFSHLSIEYTFTFPDGLYPLSGINEFLSVQFAEEGLPDDLITFVGIDSTQKVLMKFGYAGTIVLFTTPNSINTLLGFEAIDYPIAGTSVAGETYTSQNTAQINRITSWLIHCDLAPRGVPTNAIMSNIVAQIPIPSNSVGKTVGYSPYNPIRVSTEQLIGHPVNRIACRISDQINRDIDTLGEPWSFLLTLRWGIQVVEPRGFKNAQEYRDM